MTDDSAARPASWRLREEEPGDGGGRILVVSRHGDVRAALSDGRLQVPEAPAGGPVGTISWLRSSVSRFCNGAVHDERRAEVCRQLERLDPETLRRAARERTTSRLAGEETVAELSRRVPVEVLAAGLGLADDEAAATAAGAVAAAYFPGSPEEAEAAAEDGLRVLLGLCGESDLAEAVARIAILVQACDATAALITSCLAALPASPAPDRCQMHEFVYEVARHRPPAAHSRRLAAAGVAEAGIDAGDVVVCDVAAANHDPDVFEHPDAFDPGRPQRPLLTFGHGIRPCPGTAQALALAAGVVEAVQAGMLDGGAARARRDPGA